MSTEHDPIPEGFVARMLPVLEPPAGELPDPESLAALAEGRLDSEPAAALLERIRQSPAARVELRMLFPELWARHFEAPDEVPRLAVVEGGRAARLPRRRRWPILVGGALAAAAALFLLLPTGPPRSDFDVQSLELRRRSTQVLQPGQRVQLLLDLGEPSWFDRLRGAEPWGALYQVDSDGQTRLLCTSERGGCWASASTMAWLHVVPTTPGATRYAFVAGTRPYPDASALAEGSPGWDALRARLAEVAATEGWRVHERVLEVGAPR